MLNLTNIQCRHLPVTLPVIQFLPNAYEHLAEPLSVFIMPKACVTSIFDQSVRLGALKMVVRGCTTTKAYLGRQRGG